MDDDSGMGFRNWGGGYYSHHHDHHHHEPSRGLALQLMSNVVVAEQDTKPLVSGRDSTLMVSSNGAFHHRDCGVSEPHLPMEYVRDHSWIHHRDKFMHVPSVQGNPNFAVLSETSSSQAFHMLQPPDSLKDERVGRLDDGGGKNDGPLKKRQGGRSQKSPKMKKPKKPKDDTIPSIQRSKAGKKSTGIVINGIDMDIMGIPTPVCSCTGVPQQCYRWGCGGWQSACCTTSLSTYPLPMSTKRRGARIAGRKMSQGAFKKVLEKLAAEGYNLSNPIDLRTHWAKHGTNKFVTIR